MSDMMWEERPGPFERIRSPFRKLALGVFGWFGILALVLVATLFLTLFAAAWASLVVWAWNAGWWV